MLVSLLLRRDLLIFILLLLIVILSQFILLKPAVGQGFDYDDLSSFASLIPWGKTLATDPIGSYAHFGLHFTHMIYYLFFLNSLFGLEYGNYLIFSILLKVIATLSFYFLVRAISKNRLLAFLSTTLFGISYSSVGSLAYYQTGIEYLAIALMNLFLLFYYWSLQRPKFKIILISSLLLFLTFIAAPIRVSPIFALIIIMELLVFVKNKFSNITKNCLRLAALFIPIILTLMYLKTGNSVLHRSPEEVMNMFINVFLLNSLVSLGYMLVPNSALAIFGQINIYSLLDYLTSIIIPTLISGSLVLFLSFYLTKKPFRFLLTFILINFLTSLGLFILFVHPLALKQIEVTPFNLAFMQLVPNAMFVGGCVLSLALVCGIEWWRESNKNNILLFAFAAPLFSLVFFTGVFLGDMVFVTPQLHLMQGGLHRYLTIPALGISLFLASLMTLVYQRSSKKFRAMNTIIISFVFLMIFLISKNEISNAFLIKRNAGVDLATQQLMQNQLLNYLSPAGIQGDNIFLIQLTNGINNPTPFEQAFDWSHLIAWLHIRKHYLLGDYTGCIAVLYDINSLEEMMKKQNSQWGFLYVDDSNKNGQCFINEKTAGAYGKFFTFNDFLAFKIDGPVVKNITNEIKQILMTSRN